MLYLTDGNYITTPGYFLCACWCNIPMRLFHPWTPPHKIEPLHKVLGLMFLCATYPHLCLKLDPQTRSLSSTHFLWCKRISVVRGLTDQHSWNLHTHHYFTSSRGAGQPIWPIACNTQEPLILEPAVMFEPAYLEAALPHASCKVV